MGDLMADHTARSTSPTKRATIVDVAQHAGVSTASASKVLRDAYGVSEQMRERVTASMKELSYRPHRLARGMRGSTYTVGVMLSDIDNPFFGLLIQGMGDVLAERGYDILIAPGSVGKSSQEAIIDSLIDHQMDGLILVAPRSTRKHLEEIGEQIPTVVLGAHGPSSSFDTVSGDDALGSSLIVDHLVSLGHERIAFLSNTRPVSLTHIPEAVRELGYRNAMTRHGLSSDDLVIPGRWTMAGGEDAARMIMESPSRPTAIHAGADVAAIGLLSHLWAQSIDIPGEMSVVGYDNSPTGALQPISLTSVDQSGREMGAVSARLLLDRMTGRSVAENRVIEPVLVVRGTSGASPVH